MSSFLNKARDKIEATLEKRENKNRNDDFGNSTQTPVHHDTTHGTSHSATHGPGGVTTSGTYGSNEPSYDNPQSTNQGPHSSNLMNKVDPRPDSDRDHRNDPTSRVGGYGTQQTGDNYRTAGHSTDTYGSDNTQTGYDNAHPGNQGSRSSNLMNKLDPRSGSDRDHRSEPTSHVDGYDSTQQYGENYGQTSSVGGIGSTDYQRSSAPGYGGDTGLAQQGYGAESAYASHTGHASHTGPTGGLAANTDTSLPGSTSHAGVYDTSASGNTGSHRSNLMSQADPRYDSDRDHRNNPTSRVGDYGTQADKYGPSAGIQGGQGGYNQSSVGHQHPDGGNIGGYDGRAGDYDQSSYTPGSGKATKTAGPHDSNLLNKLNPMVDSDMDGSKTYGGNQTYR